MMIHGIKSFCASVLVVGLCFTAPAQIEGPSRNPADAPAGQYQLDREHTSVLWRLSHLGLSQYTGRFNLVAGSMDYDPNAPLNSDLSVRIDPTSVDTGLENFDEDLRTGRSFFNAGAAGNDTIRFVSTGMTGDVVTGEGQVVGDLTLLGQTRPVILDVTFNGYRTHPVTGAHLMGFSASTTIDRREWDLTHLVNFGIGSDVEILIEAEFLQPR